MKYGIIGAVMPLIMDGVTYKYLENSGVRVTPEFKKKVKKEYKAMVARTPGLAKGNSLEKNLYIGCYLLAYHKAYPDIVTEERFEGLINALCDEMVKRGKEDDSAISEKCIREREESALKSQKSDYEMDWVFTFKRGEGGNSYEFTYTKCGLCELGRREGCFHLIKYLCKTDYISYDLGGAKLVRDHTIANGDDCCDFKVYRKDRR
jgi:type I restriction enzyme S subunit